MKRLPQSAAEILNSLIFLAVLVVAVLGFHFPVTTSLLVQFFLLSLMGIYFSVIGFVLGPSVSFVVLTSSLICSAYARHWALLGNALMLLRWGGIVKEGIAAGSSVLFSIAIMSLCLSLGGLWFRRADLIEKGDKI